MNGSGLRKAGLVLVVALGFAFFAVPFAAVAAKTPWARVGDVLTSDDVRAATRRSGSCTSALMISSVMPSLKYSFSASLLMLANGNTASDCS